MVGPTGAAPQWSPYDQDGWDTGAYDGYAAQYFAEAHFSAHDTGTHATTGWDTGAYATTGRDTGSHDTTGWDTGAYDTTGWDTGAQYAVRVPEQPTGGPDAEDGWSERPTDTTTPTDPTTPDDTTTRDDTVPPRRPDHDASPADVVPEAGTRSRSGSRGRRRPPARRSPLLTVAVPSVCALGVATVAAVSVADPSDEAASAAPSSEPRPVRPSTDDAFASRVSGLTDTANDFGDRASREQERADLMERRQGEMQKAAAEAAKKERLRPKVVSPVAQRGLSAYYGAAGARWARGHTGIDFPVSYGTPVFSATDGVVSTRSHAALGNMVIVTAKDGTETWYCHLANFKLPPGAVVKAGDTIAWSGDTGNSSGPHLHFEVHPGGGPGIDPLGWLASHNIDPT
ncbi:M23 family metallopeptidase [Streptomyces sp. NPDC047130]|uniref:M23 family metallopeptidase n=1 Tax=Streptomyces sp. NPDC047130 TaxID=3155261 RepID=UPI0033D45568